MAAPRFLFDDDFWPSDLFLGGIQGAWYDPSDNATMFQDAAGLTPVTAVEQPVGLILDKRATAYSSNFSGSSYFSAANSSTFALGTGDFTWEAWIYPTAWSTTYAPIFVVYSDTTPGGIWVGKNGSNFVVRAAGVADQLQYGTLPTTNVWTHVAVVRSGTTLSMYYNGTRVATTTNSYSFNQGPMYVGSDTATGIPGYVSNLRLVKGSAVYDATKATLAVPTGPLSAIANTLVLTCGTTWSGNPAWTNNGATVSGLNPFTASPIGNHAYQSTAASRPVLRARYNALTQSETFTGAPWLTGSTSGAITRSTISTQDPTGATSNVSTVAFPAVPAGQYSIVYQDSGATYLNVNVTWSVWLRVASGTATIYLNVEDTAVVPAAGNFFASPALTLTTTWQRFTLTGTRTASTGNLGVFFGFDTRASAGQTNAAPLTVQVWGAQLLTAADAAATGNAYQRVGASTDYATGGVFRPYLAFDGVDDRLQTASVNIASDAVSLFAGHSIQTAGGWGSIVTSGGIGGVGIFLMISGTTGAAAYQIVRSDGTLGNQVDSSTFAYPYLDVWTMQAQISTDTLIARRNGAQTATSSSDQGSGSYASNIMYVGSYNGPNWLYRGRIYGLIVRGAASSAVEVAQTESWLNQRTGAY